MNLTPTDDELAFRTELRRWLEGHHPGPEPSDQQARVKHRLAWQRTLFDGGYAGLHWPREYGGRGATLIEQAIFAQEAALARTPGPINEAGVDLAGPILLRWGTSEQKERWLAPILRADEIWAQGFSEPDAGSDLASVTTRAERVPGGWRVTGQKTWTTDGAESHWCMLVVRTNPEVSKHRGLSVMFMAMDQPEVTVRPIRQMTGSSDFSEVFMDGAFVDEDSVIGGVDNGWRVALSTLMTERATAGITYSTTIRVALDDLVDLIRSCQRDSDPDVRRRLAALWTQYEVLRLTAWRTLLGTMEHGEPGPEGALAKWQWSEVDRGICELALDLLGNDAFDPDSPWVSGYLHSLSDSIAGGTTEILRNVIAERVLGLPRAA